MKTKEVVMVTGASSGIGLLTAVEFARAGYQVVATMRDLNRRGALDAAIAEVGAQVDVRQLDVTDFPAVPRVIGEIVAHHGRVDVLVNNAGFALGGFGEDISLDELREQMETNFFGQVAVTKAVLPHMRRQKSGHILMNSSVSGRTAVPGVGTYAASKWALEGWSEALRIEMWPLGIRVALVEPASFKTDIWERNSRLGEYCRNPESPNFERTHRLEKLVREHVQTLTTDPRDVARLFVRLAADPNPRLRHLIGGRGKVQTWMRSLLPWRLYERMLIKLMKI